MTIKKPMKAPETAEASAPAAGGATIADRFKLEAPAQTAVAKPATGKATLFAVIAGFAALVVAGILTFVIYQHWEFLQAA